MVHPYWPLFDLRVRTPRLELRLPTDDDIPGWIEAGRDVHDPSVMPFSYPWTTLPSPQFERGIAQYLWRSRAEITSEHWRLDFVVVHDGEVVGSQGLGAEHFAVARTFQTGSWLNRRWQGRGLGREMRTAVLELGFRGLGALVAETEAFEDNPTSLAVTRALGYEPNGERWFGEQGVRRRMLRYRLDRDRWAPPCDVELENVEGCLPLLGLDQQ
jgi:RimJ/RimL family protein N-acetyltransferase